MHDRPRSRTAAIRRGGLVLGALALVAGCSDDGSPEVAGQQLDRETSASTDTTTSTSSTTTTTAPTTSAAPTTTTPPPTTAAPSTAPAAPLVHPTQPPRLADTPEGIAEQVAKAEGVVRDESATEQDVADAAHLLQFAYRHLAHRPEWDAVVLASLPEDLRRSWFSNVAARREFLGMYRSERARLPAWRIVEPPPPEQLMAHYRAAEATYGVQWQYLAAIHLVETAMGRVNGVSSAGALGPMQFMPATWDAFGEGDVLDPADAIMAAARYLAHNGAPQDMDTALFNYNRHRNYVRAVQHYASLMIEDPRTHRSFHHWQVYVQTSAGDVLLPVGYEELEPVLATDYLARGG